MLLFFFLINTLDVLISTRTYVIKIVTPTVAFFNDSQYQGKSNLSALTAEALADIQFISALF